jgi:cyclic-di-AMP phosphodiesterase PgpH
VLLIITFFTVYLRSLFIVNSPRVLGRRSLIVLSALMLGFLFTARIIMPGEEIIAYLFPLSAYSLTLAALFGSEMALISILPMVLLVTYGIPNTLELVMYHVLGTMFGIFFLGRGQRIYSFLGASVIAAFSGLMIVLAYRLLESPDTMAMIMSRSFQRTMILLGAAAIANSISSAGLTIVLQFILAQILGTVSPLHLVELSRPDHPLLRLLMHAAPGSYQHSLQVANLAEQAAERVNANGLLARVGSLYHDVGKTRNPAFFIENQVPGQPNPHDDLNPVDSAAIIIAHVPDGLKLARKHRLPRRIQNFIVEHHGASLTRYQYVNAVKAAGGDESMVDESKFRYPGHRPQTRETGIVMLADGCEAAARAKRPSNENDLRMIIDHIFDTRLKDHLLDDTELTLNDLTKIKETFL